MIAPKYINTRLDFEKYNQYVKDLHQKKLTEIRNKCPRNFSVPKLPRKDRSIMPKQVLEYNKKIVKRLIEIATQKNKHRPSTPVLSTLNYLKRKHESKRINAENKRIFRKIQTATGDLRKDMLEKKFSIVQAYKSRISRSSILKKRSSTIVKSESNYSREKSSTNTKSSTTLISTSFNT